MSDTTSSHILVVEDDTSLAQTLCERLKATGYDVQWARDGQRALELWREHPPRALLLDLLIPVRSGWELLAQSAHMPPTQIIVMSASTDLRTRLKVLQTGAVDYLAKPFYMEELLARLNLRLNAQAIKPTPKAQVHHFRALRLDVEQRQCSLAGQPVELTPTEFELLLYIVQRPEQLITRQQLLSRVFHDQGERDERTVDVHLSRLRKKLSGEELTITTVWGQGWRLKA